MSPSTRRSSRLKVALALTAATLSAPLYADPVPILQVNGDTMTSYKGAATAAQGIFPLPQQRGMHVDGTLASASGLGWALAGNPFGDSWNSMARMGDLRLDTGTYSPIQIDLAFSAQVPWIVGRTYNNRQENSSGTHVDSNGYQGYNWFQISQPEIVIAENSENHSKDMLYIVYGADRFIECKRTSSTSTEYRATNGGAGIVQFVAGTPDTYVYYDQRGYRTYFFGDDTTDDKADFQIWKIVDPDDQAAFVGHATSASSAVDGYSGKKIQTAYDSSDRRFTYTYTSSRLTQVKAEAKDSGTWSSSPSGVREVGRVDYEYHSGSTDHGSEGDLKAVKIVTPLSGSSSPQTMTQVRYFRYYKGEYHSTTNPGSPHAIKLELGFEGARLFDYTWGSDSAFDDDFDLPASWPGSTRMRRTVPAFWARI